MGADALAGYEVAGYKTLRELRFGDIIAMWGQLERIDSFGPSNFESAPRAHWALRGSGGIEENCTFVAVDDRRRESRIRRPTPSWACARGSSRCRFCCREEVAGQPGRNMNRTRAAR